MRKILIILLCLPLFLFSQKEVEYDRTMSVSQFAKELKEAAVNGLDYTLDNCKITYDPKHDKQADITRYEKGILVMEDALIRDIIFSDSSKVTISNCTFGDQDKIPERHSITLTFTNCKFSHLQFDNNIVGNIILDSIIASNLSFYDARSNDIEDIVDGHGLILTNSFIKKLIIEENRQESKNEFDKRQYGASRMTVRSYHLIQTNSISHMQVKDIGGLEIDNNKLGFLNIDGENEEIYIWNNIFKLYLDNISNTFQVDDKLTCHLSIKKGITISYANIRTLISEFNKQSNNDLDKIELITFLEKNKDIRINSSSFNKKNSNDFINDSLKFNYSKEHDLKIYNSGIGKLSLAKDSFNAITIQNNLISGEMSILQNEGSIHFLNNIITQPNLIDIDTNFFYHFKFSYRDLKNYKNNGTYYNYNTSYSHGLEDYSISEDSLTYRQYKSELNGFIIAYRQLINILKDQGSEVTKYALKRLKDLESNKKMHEYYKSPNINKWFNWKGLLFLRWYSDYGMNPFKALTHCFWAMLYFAMFYFIFYNDWDKIDRGFLIKRFNSVTDYFTTEKRIEDFYSSTYDKEMTTFTEFKETLDKNKVYMPAMLASLAKPIYQLSLLRYRLLNFSYKKAEFMAGRKWVDLEKKDRYWIGALTFFLTLTYIIYLVFIRALNSIVLSINAFSTLGFGQIPVRGFTKYVAIIEGFIGWFMLSVFIVSLLSQMMSV